MIKVYWFGYGGSKYFAEELRPIINELGMILFTISEWEDSDIKWNRLTWLNELRKADIIIIPLNYTEQPAKSNNRLTQALSLGKPVICSPLPAYKRIIEQYNCALIAETNEQWKNNLELLKDEKLRQELSQKAKIASTNFSIDSIGSQWLNLFNKLEKIDIIIPSYNNTEYLKLCVDSIKKNSDGLYNIIISDSGSGEDSWKYYETLDFAIVLGKKDVRLNYSQSCNAGIKYSKTKYFVILNSDVIVSKNWLSNLKSKLDAKKDLAVCGVLSNCDRFWLHDAENKPKYEMVLKSGLELVPGMKIEQIDVEELYEFMHESNERYRERFVEQEWVAYYASIYNRDIVNKVGLLDPIFNNGCEDLDHCMRIKKMGYKMGQAIDTFVFHFGGISRRSYELEFVDEEDKENLKLRW